jgi:CO/xanthine dehydrogenase Mo-binding subunit
MMGIHNNLSRREFLKTITMSGLGLVIGIYLPGCQSAPDPETPSESDHQSSQTGSVDAWMEPSAYLRIDNDGKVTITVHRSEMGQGVRTALPMLISEELDVTWDTIEVMQAPGDRKFGNQSTGGSASISNNYLTFRKAGATARFLLIQAAAKEWGVDVETCQTENGMVIYPSSGKQAAYGELVEAASKMEAPPPYQVPLKDPNEFTIIGTPIGRVDNPEIVTGQATYASDIRLPGMLYAVVARCPVFWGKVEGYDANETESIPGVMAVIEIDEGIAVVAENTWAAIQGRRALIITWKEGKNSERSTEGIHQDLLSKAGAPEPGENKLDVIYEIPYLPHLTMEPMTCTADVQSDRCEVWAPTQSPQEAKSVVRSITGLSEKDIIVHVPLIGGGFGRRLEVDYVEEAVKISQEIGGPIKLFWSRDDDIQHDRYHPMSIHRVIMDLENPELPDAQFSRNGSGVPTGAWRSVSNMPEAFVRETAIDEMAIALGRDPYELRLELENPSYREVLQLAADQAGWRTPLPEGWGRGIACYSTFGVTPVAIVAEVFVDVDMEIRVKRVVCAIDCGMVVNPNMVEAQMEGGIIFGITAALKDTISIKKGRVEQNNFHQCQLLKIDEMPEIEIILAESNQPPSGVGEMAVPPIIPAIGNAVYDATGKRLRRLPFKSVDLLG